MAEAPELIGKYRITQLVAHGGMGSVFKAVHPTLNRNVILKKLTIRGKPQFIERFKREARIMMDFKHDNIVTDYDHFKEGNSYYIVLEYVDGFSLEELIRRERALPSALALFIFLEVSKALKYAHDNGVIHRDIKPANILISKKGEVKLVDFGIAGYESEGQAVGRGLNHPGHDSRHGVVHAPGTIREYQDRRQGRRCLRHGRHALRNGDGEETVPGQLLARHADADQAGKIPSRPADESQN